MSKSSHRPGSGDSCGRGTLSLRGPGCHDPRLPVREVRKCRYATDQKVDDGAEDILRQAESTGSVVAKGAPRRLGQHAFDHPPRRRRHSTQDHSTPPIDQEPRYER